jgi:hypothetical protein
MLWRQRGKWHAGMRSAFLHAVGDHGDLMCSALGSHAWNQSANPCCTQLTTDIKRADATWAIAPVFCSQRMPQTLIENRLHRGRMHMGTRTSFLVSAHATWNTLCHSAAAACMSLPQGEAPCYHSCCQCMQQRIHYAAAARSPHGTHQLSSAQGLQTQADCPAGPGQQDWYDCRMC